MKFDLSQVQLLRGLLVNAIAEAKNDNASEEWIQHMERTAQTVDSLEDEMDMKTEDGIVHVYAQEEWHDEAFLVGNRVGIIQLRDGLDKALEAGASSIWVTTADGEGYELHIAVEDAAFASETWNNIRLPYRNEIASQVSQKKEEPWDVMNRKKLESQMK